MRVFKVFFLFISLTLSWVAQAQQNNQILLWQVPVKEQNANEIRVEVSSLGYFRNNEYFSKIADGYSLFGYQLQPSLSYQPSAHVRLQAGVLLRKDFGSSGYEEIAPTFTIAIAKNNWQLLFGTLEGNLSHGYIEPLYDFERLIYNRLENGIQYKLQNSSLRLDAWVDWVNMIYRGDAEQEQIHGGATVAVRLLTKEGRANQQDSLRLTLPVQFTAQHKGGQIDASILPLTTLANAAIGLELEKLYSKRLLLRLYTMNYVVGYKDFSNETQLAYTQGHGLYLNLGADTKVINTMLSYWRGEGYIAELGGRLYQSASTSFKNPDFVQERRNLLLLRLMKDYELAEGLALVLRLEPVLDFADPQLEFSSGVYFNFTTDFFVAKPRR